MNCPECSLSLPEETGICPKCGVVLKKESSPETSESAKAVFGKKRNVPAIIFGILFAATFAALVFLIYRHGLLLEENAENINSIHNQKIRIHSLEQNISSDETEISDLETQLHSLTIERNALLEKQEYSEEIMKILSSEEYWGYATENFHVDKGIMVLNRFGGISELKLYSTYYTNFTFEVSDTEVCIANWSDEEWVNKDTTLFVTPVSSGYATITFSNDLYDNSFKVLVIVK